ncbi:hypothetical protein Tsubulata_049402 [Turnera subulata]|uniref:Ricin B lectin domain-containing protein n=1 Tax=Turnera subulata TaxID=218843 RepID=A0A9Q0F615_9ROSI|nr:hypothetical protein Tsubulata_049402 [Turnera subulata]
MYPDWFHTIQVDILNHVPGQGWTLDEGPRVKRLKSDATAASCLTLGPDKYTVGMGDCADSMTSNWEVIALSSIGNNGKCLTCEDEDGRTITCQNGSRIVARDCCVGLPSQRWRYWSGRFSNPGTGFYLTLDNSGNHVIAASGNPSNDNQGWSLI